MQGYIIEGGKIFVVATSTNIHKICLGKSDELLRKSLQDVEYHIQGGVRDVEDIQRMLRGYCR